MKNVIFKQEYQITYILENWSFFLGVYLRSAANLRQEQIQQRWKKSPKIEHIPYVTLTKVLNL